MLRALKILDWVTDLWNRMRGRAPRRSRKEVAPNPQTSFRRLDHLSAKPAESLDLSSPAGEVSVPVSLEDGKRIYAIGDIHGRADLLDRLVEVIETDCKSTSDEITLVFLGDYIDRGFQSKQVIDKLCELESSSRFQTVFLMGNHEQAMLRFLDDHTIGPDWSAFGGRETLISYGIIPPRDVKSLDQWLDAQASLNSLIPPHHVAFLEALQSHHRIGGFGFVHAGIRPGVPFDEQSDEDRLWIREAFLNADKKEDLFIVHGHSPVDDPFVDHRRINTDTGAYFTGTLCAAKLSGASLSFVTNHTIHQEA